MKRKIAIEVLSGLLILLFLYTGLSKLMDYETFRFTLSRSPLLAAYAGLIALGLPVLEIMLAGLLFIPVFRLWGFRVSFLLLLVLTLYLIYMVLFSPDLPCSCGGVIGQLSWQQHIFFNLLFIFLAALGIRFWKGSALPRKHYPP